MAFTRWKRSKDGKRLDGSYSVEGKVKVPTARQTRYSSKEGYLGGFSPETAQKIEEKSIEFFGAKPVSIEKISAYEFIGTLKDHDTKRSIHAVAIIPGIKVPVFMAFNTAKGTLGPLRIRMDNKPWSTSRASIYISSPGDLHEVIDTSRWRSAEGTLVVEKVLADRQAILERARATEEKERGIAFEKLASLGIDEERIKAVTRIQYEDLPKAITYAREWTSKGYFYRFDVKDLHMPIFTYRYHGSQGAPPKAAIVDWTKMVTLESASDIPQTLDKGKNPKYKKPGRKVEVPFKFYKDSF